MLFVVDVGNTSTVMGVYQGKHLKKKWRVKTIINATENEFYTLAAVLFEKNNMDVSSIDKIIISSVVPEIKVNLEFFCREFLGHIPFWVDETSYLKMPVLYHNPGELGADRIVNAVAAFEKYKTSLIVIDFGTATTFDFVSENGDFIGGAISPGIKTASDALFVKASKLPKVSIDVPPEKVICKDTVNSLKSGIIHGYAGLVDGMVKRMIKEINSIPKVIATGGLAGLIYGVAETIETIEPDLTLEGLQIIGSYIK